jgi:hypothetical protein
VGQRIVLCSTALTRRTIVSAFLSPAATDARSDRADSNQPTRDRLGLSGRRAYDRYVARGREQRDCDATRHVAETYPSRVSGNARFEPDLGTGATTLRRRADFVQDGVRCAGGREVSSRRVRRIVCAQKRWINHVPRETERREARYVGGVGLHADMVRAAAADRFRSAGRLTARDGGGCERARCAARAEKESEKKQAHVSTRTCLCGNRRQWCRVAVPAAGRNVSNSTDRRAFWT